MLLEILIFIIVYRLFGILTNGICKSNVCLVGKTALITGGSTGLGYQTALGLASRGCRVIIASRSCTENVKNDIIKHTHNPNIITKYVEFGSLKSVRKLAEDIIQTEERLDILINNAGAGGLGNNISDDGLHIGFQTNQFAPFLLTYLLLDLLKKSKPSRVIFVSSIGAVLHTLTDVRQLTTPSLFYKESAIGPILEYFEDWFVYANSKVCNIITANEYAERLRGTGITVNSVHPGMVATNIYERAFHNHFSNFFNKLAVRLIFFTLHKTVYDGAQTIIHAAISTKLENVTGVHFWDCIPFFTPRFVKNKQFCNAVWKENERLLNIRVNDKL